MSRCGPPASQSGCHAKVVRMRLAMPRILLLLFMLCMTTMLFITHCGLNIDSPSTSQMAGMRSLESARGESQFLTPEMQALQGEVKRLQEAVRSRDHSIGLLEQRVEHLKMQLEEARSMASDVINKQQTADGQGTESYYQNYIQEKIKESEIVSGIHLNNEFEIIPFCRFTLSRIYLVDPGMGKRVVEKPIGFKKKDVLEIVSFALAKLNDDRKRKPQYTSEDFFEGIYRTEPSMGTHYELYFRDLDSPPAYRKVVVTRPFAPPHLVSKGPENTRKTLINLILPLSGRVDKFQAFMARFRRVCIARDKRVYLTVVYFGTEGQQQVRDTIEKVSKEMHFANIKLVTLSNEQFSRGRGLQVGAQSWQNGDVLMFLCDVDIVFSTDFLERCRLNAEKGRRVYYPMVFSLYNPKVVYAMQDLEIPPEKDQLIISKDAGFWRDFGFGMTCQYRSDFLNLKGFDEKITGWGTEDTYLYRKYVKSNLMVIRATDPGLFHLWHEKYCDPELQPDQYKGCIRSKALNEAGHAQMGMLAFKEEIDAHKSLFQSRKLPRS